MSIDPDLFLVIGMVVAILAVPALLGAFSEGRPPRAAAIMVMIGGGMIAVAVMEKPGGYSIHEAPSVFYEVVGRYIN